MARTAKVIPPFIPGKPFGLSANRLPMELSVPVTRINYIVRARPAITADTALRLVRYFGISFSSGMTQRANHGRELAQDMRGAEIADLVRPRKAA